MSIGKYVWVALLCISVIPNTATRRQFLETWRAMSIGAFASAFALLVVVIATSILIAKVQPWTEWSWLSLLGAPSGNLNLQPAMDVRWLAPWFLGLFFVAIPNFAHLEESWFRAGTTTWREGLLRSLAFGFIHCLVGVPLCAGFALSLGGLWFTRCYFAGGITLSTVHHSAYNSIICFAAFSIAVLRVAR